MQRNVRGTNRDILPIFGNRKRQRQAMFADSIDFSADHDNSLFVDDDMLNDKPNNVGRQQNRNNLYQTNSTFSNMNVDVHTNMYNNEPTQHASSFTPCVRNNNNVLKPSNRNNSSTYFSQTQSNHFSNNSFDQPQPSQVRSFNNNNMNVSSSMNHRQSNLNNTYHFPSQNRAMNNSNNNSYSFSNQTQPMSRPNTFSQPMSRSKDFPRENQSFNRPNSSGFSTQQMGTSSGGKNSFNYSGQKKSSNRNTNTTGCSLGTLPPPNKCMKTSMNRNHKQGMVRNESQKHQVSFSDKTTTHQFLKNKPTSHTSNQSLTSYQSDAVVPETKVETKSPSTSFSVKKQGNPTTKLITSTIGGLDKWSNFIEKYPIVFELCGNLCSAIPYNSRTSEKMFTISDGTGDIRCIFWEIDRKLPQLSRGSTVRCVGKLHDGYFHCLCVRNVKPREMQLMKKLIEKSDKMLHKEITELRAN